MSAPRDGDRGPHDHVPDDDEAIDRAFAELVANYHLTADPPDPLPPRALDPEPPLRVEPEPPRVAPLRTDPAGTDSSRPDVPRTEPSRGWADDHPLFLGPVPTDPNAGEPDLDERYVPEPQPPMARPRLPILLAWIAIAYAAVIVLLAAFGVRLPPWAGWISVASFMGGFGVLVFHLPRSRPPGDDGAVL